MAGLPRRFTDEERATRTREQKRAFNIRQVARGRCRTCGDPWAGQTVNCRACRQFFSKQRYARLGRPARRWRPQPSRTRGKGTA